MYIQDQHDFQTENFYNLAHLGPSAQNPCPGGWIFNPLFEDKAHSGAHFSSPTILTLHLDAVLESILAVSKHEYDIPIADFKLPP